MARWPGWGAQLNKPRAGSLDDPWARLRRARHHIETLDSKFGISTYLSSYPLRYEVHADGLEYRFYLIDDVPEVHADVPVIVSECLHNLRSALDQLVYQLHVRYYRGRVPADAERAAEFPIITSEKVTNGASTDPAKWNSIRRLSERDRRAIAQYQPFLGTSGTGRNAETRGVLEALEHLNNIDKHRRVANVSARAAPVSKKDQFDASHAPRQTIFHRPLVKDAEVERWTFDEPPEAIDETQLCWAHIGFDERSLGIRVFLPAFVDQAHGHVAAVVRRFNTRFGLAPWEEGARSQLIAG